MDYLASVALLKKYRIRFAETGVAENKAEAKKLAKKIGYPVVLKVLSKEISHKSDRGCVRVGINDEKSLEIAFDEILANAGNATVNGVAVQKMAVKGLELIVGGKRDQQFGPLILFGVGGIFVELLRDVSIRVCPIDEQDAQEMIREIHTYRLLEGFRGTHAVDQKALKQLLVAVSKMLVNEKIAELDLNPIISYDKGYVAVDVRIVDA